MRISTFTLSRVMSFAVLGALTARQLSQGAPIVALGAAVGGAASWAPPQVIARLASMVNPGPVRAQGEGALRATVDRGFVMLVPFAVLAAVAQLALDWGAAQAFVSAALMTSGATIGSEMAGWGGRRAATAIATTASMIVLSGAWTMLSAYAVRWV